MVKPYILAIGDSLTAGYGLPLHDSFPAQLQAILRNRFPGAVIQNAGISGDTSATARQRLPRLLTSLNALPDLAIVELGANDFLQGVSPRQTYLHLDLILDEIGRCGIPVLIAAMEVPAFLGSFAQDCAAIYSDLAEKHRAAIWPFYPASVLGNPALSLPDRLHPNARAISMIARHMAPAVIAALTANVGADTAPEQARIK
jgi:acyl-CoA thioesterase-1